MFHFKNEIEHPLGIYAFSSFPNYFRPDEVNDLYEEVAYEEMEFAMETEEDDDVEGVEEELGPGIKRVLTEEGVEPLIEATVCFAHVEQILSLAGTNVNKCLQADCQHPDSIRLIDEFIGSALYLKWVY